MKRLPNIIKNYQTLSLVVAFVLAVSWWLFQNHFNTNRVQLVSCIDGDTAIFAIDQHRHRVRFLGIDTPEVIHPEKGEEAWGREASDYTCRRLMGARHIELKYEQQRSDRYQRLLAWVIVDGELLQRELLAQGLAKVAFLSKQHSYASELREAQKEAQKQGLGMWNEKNQK